MKLKITLLGLAQLLWLTPELSAQCDGATFEEKNGIAVIEVESSSGSGWSKRSGDSSIGGRAYMAYTGSNAFRAPGNTVLNYKVKINSPGTYRFIWHNKVGIIASSNPSTEHNDSWLRIPDASNFFGKKGSSIVYPKGSGKSPTPNGDGTNGWFKVFLNGTTNWTWATKVSDNDSHDVYASFNRAGVYTIQVAGRSNGHFIDRMVLYKESSYSSSQAQSIARGETRCGSGSTPPPPTEPTPPTSNAKITSFQYVNADTEKVLGTLTSGMQISLAAINNAELNFVAITDPGTVGSVRLDISGALNRGGTENGSAPYSVFGDSGFSNYYGRSLTPGSYTLTATPYSGSNLSGSKGASSSISFTVVNGGGTTPPPTDPTPPSGGLKIASFQYVNADRDQVLGTMTNGMQISLAAINNAELNFVAVTDPGNVGSVRLDISGALNRGGTENGSAPYSVFGDKGSSDLFGRSLRPGSYTLTATPYSGSNLGGTKGTSSSINFTIIEGGTSTPPPPPTDSTPPSGGLEIASFQYVNADKEQVLGTMTSGMQISLATIGNAELNFVAITAPGTVGSVRFDISGALNRGKIENGAAPYSVFGDKGSSDLFGRNLAPGSYTLTATPYSGSNLSGTKGSTSTLSFTIVSSGTTTNPPSNPSAGNLTIAAFRFANGDTDNIVGTMVNGMEIDLATINNAELNFLAVTNPGTVGSVRFDISGTLNRGRVANGSAPYSVFGDKGYADLFGRSLVPGNYTLTATPYSGSNLSGTKGITAILSFRIVNSSTSKSLTARTAPAQSYVYPNPVTQNTFSVKVPDEVEGTVNYSLVNNAGVEVETGSFNVAAEKNITLSLATLTSRNTGMYYLVMKSASGKYTVPLIKN